MSIGRYLPAVATYDQARVAQRYGLELAQLAVQYGEDLPGQTQRLANLSVLQSWEGVWAAQGDMQAQLDQVSWEALKRACVGADGDCGATIAGAEAQAELYTRLQSDLVQGAVDLPETLGNAVGSVASAIGDAAGKAAGGLFSGLGATGLVLLCVAGLVGYLVLTRKV